jgi:predicted lysophospholipase L1 biosynthesis ABC-type transport system permease subunit
MLISRAGARLFWGDADPIGRRATLPLESKTVTFEIVGIVGDVKQGELSEPAMPTVYEYSREREWRNGSFAIRTSVPPESVAQPAVSVIRGVDPQQPVEDVRTLQQVLEETLTSQRFSALVLGLFAAVALALASVGIYSVLSYIVRGRRQEIGIRAALGARTSDVVGLVVREGLTPTVAGIVAGSVAALLVARLLQKIVFGVSPSDPLTLAAAAGMLLLVATAASLVPAYRACRLDPVEVLRTP